jgi:hypothetical protein
MLVIIEGPYIMQLIDQQQIAWNFYEPTCIKESGCPLNGLAVERFIKHMVSIQIVLISRGHNSLFKRVERIRSAAIGCGRLSPRVVHAHYPAVHLPSTVTGTMSISIVPRPVAWPLLCYRLHNWNVNICMHCFNAKLEILKAVQHRSTTIYRNCSSKQNSSHPDLFVLSAP